MRGPFTSRSAIAVFTCVLTAAVVGGVGYAVASTGGTGTTFYACASATGVVRPSSMSAGTAPTCKTGETAESWNQQGKTGPQGPVGQASVVNVGTPVDCAVAPPTSTATTDQTQSFLEIPSIPGASTDPAHLNQIEIKDWSFDVEDPTTIGSACPGAGSGKIAFGEFTITKLVDNASPYLFGASTAHTNLGTVTLHVAKAGTDFLTYQFGTVFTTKVTWQHSDDGPTEQITFVYDSLRITYTPQLSTGGTAPPISSCFDATTQTAC